MPEIILRKRDFFMRKSVKKLLSMATSVAIAASAFSAFVFQAGAEDTVTELAPVADTYVSSGEAVDNSEATELRIIQTTKIALFKFDASAVKASGATITGAEFKINTASRSYNDGRSRWESSSLIVAETPTEWEDTIVFEEYSRDSNTVISDKVEWTSNDATTPSDGVAPYVEKTFDVTEVINSDDDGIVAFAVYTGTGREQAIASAEDTEFAPSLTITSTTEALVDYTLTAVTTGNEDLGIVVSSGEDVVNTTVEAVGIPEYVEKDGTYYHLADSTVSGYKKSINLGDTDYTGTVVYEEATDVLFYNEAENLPNNLGASENEEYSNGAYSAITGNKAASLGTYPAGAYTLYAYLVERGDRGIYIRNASNTDNTVNTIASATIDRNSPAGIYEIEFVL